MRLIDLRPNSLLNRMIWFLALCCLFSDNQQTILFCDGFNNNNISDHFLNNSFPHNKSSIFSDARNDRFGPLLLLNNSRQLSQTVLNSNSSLDSSVANDASTWTSNTPTNSNSAKNNDSSQHQNQFQSSISCGHLEFYVQLTFNKPFNGLVYAYKMYRSEEASFYNQHYPIQILDSCLIKGNGASIIYLELSFLSECVERLLSHHKNSSNSSQTNATNINTKPNHTIMTPSASTNNNTETTVNNETTSNNNQPIFNLDGFNFRRALNSHILPPHYINISKDETYQLSLYIQNDPQIEQKFDSKVTVQCSSQVTKSIILEQNMINELSRKIDHPHHSDEKSEEQERPFMKKNNFHNRLILPKVNLTIRSHNFDGNLSSLVESRMDILRGRIPFLKLIDSINVVELGDDLTLIIRSRQLDDYDSKISNCYAFDEGLINRFQLTNEEGCPIDPMVMPGFKVLRNVGSESKVYYTTFASFKFPGSHFLNIQCTLLVCYHICPKPACEQPATRR